MFLKVPEGFQRKKISSCPDTLLLPTAGGGSGNVYNGPTGSVIVLMFAADHIRSHASLNTGSDLWEHADGAKYLQHLSHFNQSKYHEYLLKDFHHCKKSTQTMCTHALEDFPQKENITMHCECNSSYLSCSADKPGGGINILFWFYRFKCCSGDTFLRILLLAWSCRELC